MKISQFTGVSELH